MVKSISELIREPRFAIKVVALTVCLTIIGCSRFEILEWGLYSTVRIAGYFHSYVHMIGLLLIEHIFFTRTFITDVGLHIISLLQLFVGTNYYTGNFTNTVIGHPTEEEQMIFLSLCAVMMILTLCDIVLLIIKHDTDS